MGRADRPALPGGLSVGDVARINALAGARVRAALADRTTHVTPQGRLAVIDDPDPDASRPAAPAPEAHLEGGRAPTAAALPLLHRWQPATGEVSGYRITLVKVRGEGRPKVVTVPGGVTWAEVKAPRGAKLRVIVVAVNAAGTGPAGRLSKAVHGR